MHDVISGGMAKARTAVSEASIEQTKEALSNGVARARTAVSEVGMEQTEMVKNLVELCERGATQGWHERNGGNVSYRFSAAEVSSATKFFAENPGEWVALKQSVSTLAGDCFLVTAAGSYLAEVPKNPSEWLGVVEISSDGSAYRAVWGFSQGAAPTSELASHLLIHEVKKQAAAQKAELVHTEGAVEGAADGADRVLYHAHPASVVALTCTLAPDSRLITRTLWKTHTECVMVFPEGIGVVGCAVPGSVELAESTAELMKSHKAVIWDHHGLFVSAPTCREAFGLAQVVSKAADMYGRAVSIAGGIEKVRLIGDDELVQVARGLNVEPAVEYWESV